MIVLALVSLLTVEVAAKDGPLSASGCLACNEVSGGMSTGLRKLDILGGGGTLTVIGHVYVTGSDATAPWAASTEYWYTRNGQWPTSQWPDNVELKITAICDQWSGCSAIPASTTISGFTLASVVANGPAVATANPPAPPVSNAVAVVSSPACAPQSGNSACSAYVHNVSGGQPTTMVYKTGASGNFSVWFRANTQSSLFSASSQVGDVRAFKRLDRLSAALPSSYDEYNWVQPAQP